MDMMEVNVKVFDLRQLKVAPFRVIQLRASTDDLSEPWISVLGKHLQDLLPDGPLESQEMHFLATTWLKQGSNKFHVGDISEITATAPLHLALGMEHGIVILPPKRRLKDFVFVLYKECELIAVALKKLSVGEVKMAVGSIFKEKVALKLTHGNSILKSNQQFSAFASSNSSNVKGCIIINAVVVKAIPLVLDILAKGSSIIKWVSCVSTETVSLVCRRVAQILQKEDVLRSDESVAFLIGSVFAIPDDTCLMQFLLDIRRIGNPLIPVPTRDDVPLEIKVLKKPLNSFAISVSTGNLEVPIYVTEDQKVLDVKKHLCAFWKSVPVGKQRFQVGSRELNDQITLKAAGIVPNNTIYLTSRDPITLKLFCDVLSDAPESYTVELFPCDEVQLLVSHAAMWFSLPEDQVVLRRGDEWLEEDQTLKAAGLQDEDDLRVHHSPHKISVPIHVSGKKSYKQYIPEGQTATVQWIIDVVSKRFGLKRSQLYVVLHPGGTILEPEAVVREMAPLLGRLSVHQKPITDVEEYHDERLSYRFICGANPPNEIQRQLITIVNDMIFSLSLLGHTPSASSQDAYTANAQSETASFLDTTATSSGSEGPQSSTGTVVEAGLQTEHTACIERDSDEHATDIRSSEIELKQAAVDTSEYADSNDRVTGGAVGGVHQSYSAPLRTDFTERQRASNSNFQISYRDSGHHLSTDTTQEPPFNEPRIYSPQFSSSNQRNLTGPMPIPQDQQQACSEPEFEDDEKLESVSMTGSIKSTPPILSLQDRLSRRSSRCESGRRSTPLSGTLHPERKVLNKVKRTAAKLIGSDWPQLARELAVDEEEIERIRTKHRELSDQSNSMLHRWTQQLPNEGVEELVKALEGLRRNDIVGEIDAICDFPDNVSEASSYVSRV